jgi:hypothetical protein
VDVGALRPFARALSVAGAHSKRGTLDGVPARLPCADANHVFQWHHEDLAVSRATVAVGCSEQDGIDGRLDEGIVDGNLQTYFGVQVGCDHCAAVQLGVLLSAMAGAATNSETRDLAVGEGLSNRLEAVRLNDSDNHLHGVLPGARHAARGPCRRPRLLA